MPYPRRNPTPEHRWRLSTNLKTLRRKRGYTQQALANKCRWSRAFIGNVEQGRVNISLERLEVLAAALRCTEEDLLTMPGSLSPVVRKRYNPADADGLYVVTIRKESGWRFHDIYGGPFKSMRKARAVYARARRRDSSAYLAEFTCAETLRRKHPRA